MTDTLQQAEVDLRAHITRLQQLVTDTRSAKIHAEEEYERARDMLQAANSSLNYLTQFREQLGACDVSIKTTLSDPAKNDMTQPAAHHQEGVQ